MTRLPAVRGLAAGAALALALTALAARAQEPPLSTFSIVACDPETGMLGVAIQSRVVAAGTIVPAARAGVGAIATQAAANVGYKTEALEMLEAGASPEEVRAHFVASDAGVQRRQFAIMDSECRVAAFTGDSTNGWAGHRTGERYSVQGNILTGPEVIDSMAAAFERAEAAALPFGERLLGALRAGQAAGGDRRGRQGAGLLIVREEGGYAGGDDRYADLRVEDSPAPILELERIYDVFMSTFHAADHFLPNGTKPFAAPAGPHVCELRNLLAAAGHGEPTEQRWCALDAATLAALEDFQRAEDLPVRPALDEATVERLREAVVAQ